jgi:osmotically-inducible protein OsmY
MCKLFFLPLVAVGTLAAYNLSTGNDLFHVPGSRTIANTVRETVGDTVRDGVRSAARETSAGVRDGVRTAAREAKDGFREARAEVNEHASDGVRSAVNGAEEAVSAASLTSKIKAKMALDDLVIASDINVDTEGSVVTLTGSVGSKDEQRRALRIATETAGVTKVVNRLKIRGQA